MRRDSLGKILLGMATGTAFGFFLHRGRASEQDVFSSQLLLEDASVVKIMATASAVGAAGTYALSALDRVDTKVKPLNAGGVTLGGILFGAGMALFGYCPGTSMAAIGGGHKDAAAGAAGMMGGALGFVKAYPHIKPIIEKGGVGKRTLPEITGSSPWLWVSGLAAAVAAGATLLEKR